MVVQDKGMINSSLDGPMLTSTVALGEVPYLDFPELKFSANESTEMPFRYVKGEDGQPIMPAVSTEPSESDTIFPWLIPSGNERADTEGRR